MTQKVFVSSTIDDLATERETARSAISDFGMTPVMAEYDFPSQSNTPRQACLDGVRRSEIFMGILGPKYGYVPSDSGVSVVHEEFNEAVRLKKRIIWLIKRCERDPLQDDFCKEVSSFSNGYFRTEFDTLLELHRECIKALRHYTDDLSNSDDRMSIIRESSIEIFNRIASDCRDQQLLFRSVPVVESGLDVLVFEDEKLTKSLMSTLCYGEKEIFDPGVGITLEQTATGVEIKVPGTYRYAAPNVDVKPSGEVVACLSLSGDDRIGSRKWDLADSMLLDPDVVRRQIQAAIYFSKYVTQAFTSDDRLVCDIAISSPDSRLWGARRDGQSAYGSAFGMEALRNPLFADSKPTTIGASEDSDTIVADILKRFERHYRSAKLLNE